MLNNITVDTIKINFLKLNKNLRTTILTNGFATLYKNIHKNTPRI